MGITWIQWEYQENGSFMVVFQGISWGYNRVTGVFFRGFDEENFGLN